MEPSMRGIMSALVLLAGAVLASREARAEVSIAVDKSTQRMTVMVDGEQRFSWPVSTGMAGFATPDGGVQSLTAGATAFLQGMGQCADASFHLLHR